MSTNVLYDAPGPKARRRSRILSVVVVVVVARSLAWVVVPLGRPRVSANGQSRARAARPVALGHPASTRTLWGASAAAARPRCRPPRSPSVLALVLGVLFSLLRTARTAWVRIPTTSCSSSSAACPCC